MRITDFLLSKETERITNISWAFWTARHSSELFAGMIPELPEDRRSYCLHFTDEEIKEQIRGRTGLESRYPDAKNWIIGKDPDAGKDWREEQKGTTEDEMVGWHHQLNGHEFEQAPGVSVGQGSLACCSLWGHKESDTTEWQTWTELSLTSGCVVLTAHMKDWPAYLSCLKL